MAFPESTSSYFDSNPSWAAYEKPVFKPGNSSTSSSSTWQPDKEGWGVKGGFDPYGIGKESKSTQESSDKSKWIEAVDAANKFKQNQQQQQGSGGSGFSPTTGAGWGTLGDGSFGIYTPGYRPQQQASGSSGLGSAIGTLAGIGASFIPGLGPGIAAAMPAIGGQIGSMFG